MEIRNMSKEAVLLTVGHDQYRIESMGSVILDPPSPVCVLLRHEHPSTAMSIDEIRKDDMRTTSIVDVWISRYLPPYFDLFLDSTYKLDCPDHAVMTIRGEKIRPCYPCSYNRFYPSISDGKVQEISYTFQEKDAYAKHYQTAVCGSNKKIVQILTVLLGIMSLPIGALFFIANWMVGAVVLALELLGLFTVFFIGNRIVEAIATAESKRVLSEFESQKIARYFTKEKEKSSPKIEFY